MNKIFKRTIGSLLAVATFATVGPVKYTSLFTTEAHASTSKNSDMITDINIGKSEGDDDYSLYDKKKCKKKVDFDAGETDYYVNAKSKNKVYVSADVKSGYSYEVYRGSKEANDEGKISLSSSSTKVYVKVYEDENVENGNKKTLKETYKITVLRNRDKDDDDDDDDDDYDDIYLDNLEVDGDEINLKESKTTYTVDVKESKTSVKIVAEPDDKDYKVKIDGDTVDDDDDYEKKVTLKKGKNEFKIRLRDNDKNERIYTLIINRGSSSDKDEDKTEDKNNSNSNNNTNVTAIPNQWITVNGNVMYNDSLGNSIKNNWFMDRNTGAWHCFDANGYMRKGWFSSNGNWYYLNQYSGQMQTGWSYINGQWYYLNPYSDGTRGAMKTGWINNNGTWYYLNPQSGEMKTGWINDNGTWYYCDWSGQMLRNTTVNGYRLASSGAWIR
ncbi:cell wall-binding protein [Clostridium botulinum]|uniref:N-acetylmuramoyl-L-alanine amidase family protein n=1 Tax=Clostridium botulinum TaxID=1491 RepID=UPI001967ED48|nr:cadherin-like beta sandwich domain-containing protein [Clostridium botulinum]MBN1072353.1 cell wall-binding protein [Clostridium botulinum]